MILRWLRHPSELITPLEDLIESCGAGNCHEPFITDGARLFTDPLLTPRHGDYVQVRGKVIPGTDIDETIKQYQVVRQADGRKVELICNSAGRFRLVDEKILGVVVAFANTGQPSTQGAAVAAAHAQTIANIKARVTA